MFRTYLARFGIDSPARLEPDRVRSDAVLLEALQEVLTHLVEADARRDLQSGTPHGAPAPADVRSAQNT